MLKSGFYQSNSAAVHSLLRQTRAQGVDSSLVPPGKQQNQGREGSDAAASKWIQTAFLHVLNCSVMPSLWNPESLQTTLSLLCKSPEELELSLQKYICSPSVISISIFPNEFVQTQILASKAGSFQTDQTQPITWLLYLFICRTHRYLPHSVLFARLREHESSSCQWLKHLKSARSGGIPNLLIANSQCHLWLVLQKQRSKQRKKMVFGTFNKVS